MKIINILLLSIALFLITACGNRTPFKTQTPLEKASLVYIYTLSQVSFDDNPSNPEYSIRINNKRYSQRIKEDEYIALNLKPQKMTISATKKQIEEKVLNMDLKIGQIYYVKMITKDGGSFEFVQVNNDIGSKEITKTGLAGSSEEAEENIITEFINPKDTESVEVKATTTTLVPTTNQTVAPMSKTDEIMKAYDLKQKGIINDEEFKTLKINILSK
ncbi:hypothetical protein [Sulfurimonas sp.]|uniref:hypothetical protein n=1 Tax=Sulfurimonas sp. TaxID=2022749 RepID=UPI0025E3D9B6|nr:hypothetical protein [Sulfurimonas sp.]